MKLYELSRALAKHKRAGLGTFPTPLHRLEGLEKKYKHRPLWIKRDDLTGLGLGGNKARTLEYILGDALLKDADTIIVCGPLQSNMCALTAAASRKVGLDCLTVHNDGAPEVLSGNLVLNSLLGAKPYYIGKKDEEERAEFARELARTLKDRGKKPYVISDGGSSSLGSLGYVDGALELYRQVVSQGLNLKHVFMPAGNGGTVSGLIAGMGLAGIRLHVHVISVEYPKEELRQIIASFINGIEDRLNIKIPLPLEELMTVYDDYRGEGWGKDTRESQAMMDTFPQLEGIFLENIYTSKVVVGMTDLVEKGIIGQDEGACYWHTGGLAYLFL